MTIPNYLSKFRLYDFQLGMHGGGCEVELRVDVYSLSLSVYLSANNSSSSSIHSSVHLHRMSSENVNTAALSAE